MKKGIIAVLFVLIAVGVSNAQVTAIRAGRIVDPETGTVASNQIILIEGQDIKAIGANVAIPPGATVVDPVSYTHLDVYKRQDTLVGPQWL